MSSFSQKESFNFNKTYSVAQILEDINYTEKYLTKFHPDPFKYISKDSLYAFILKQKERIDSPLTEMQLRFYVKQIIAKIGCGHSDVAASKKYTNAIKKTNRPILPVNVFVNDSNQLFIFNNLSELIIFSMDIECFFNKFIFIKVFNTSITVTRYEIHNFFRNIGMSQE